MNGVDPIMSVAARVGNSIHGFLGGSFGEIIGYIACMCLVCMEKFKDVMSQKERRKEASRSLARVWLVEGSGNIADNTIPMDPQSFCNKLPSYTGRKRTIITGPAPSHQISQNRSQ